MWADCLAFYHLDIRQLDGATAMDLACRVLEQAPYAPDGMQLGSVAARAREAKREEELQSTNYNPDRENEVIEDADLAALLADGELDPTDFDWS